MFAPKPNWLRRKDFYTNGEKKVFLFAEKLVAEIEKGEVS